MKENVRILFKENNGVLKAASLYTFGVTRNEMSEMLKSEKIIRVKKGYYQVNEFNPANDVALITQLFPEAILCRETALFYYGYSDRTPSKWNISVARSFSKSRLKITYPFIKTYFVEERFLKIGVGVGEISGVKVLIYDREKTICDCIRHRNKMDSEMFAKVIQSYLADISKNIVNLSIYSKQLNISKKTQELIGIWL